MKYKINSTTAQKEISSFINKNLNDPWEGTVLANYKFVNNKQKGAMGEMIVEVLTKELGSIVKSAESGTAPYDRIIDGYKTEIKFSAAHSDNSKTDPALKRDKEGRCYWAINHVGINKGWDRLIFCGADLVDGDVAFTMVWCTKQDFKECVDDGEFFRRQQGGKDGGNDDYICAGTKPVDWTKSKFVRSIAEW